MQESGRVRRARASAPELEQRNCGPLFTALTGRYRKLNFSMKGLLVHLIGDQVKDFLKDFIYLFIFKEGGREGEREGEKHQCVVASRVPPAGDMARNPGLCPDSELNRRPFGLQALAQSTEPQQPGQPE